MADDLHLPPGAKLVDSGMALPPGAKLVQNQNGGTPPSTMERIGKAASQFVGTYLSDMNPMSTVRAVLHPFDTLKQSFGPGAWVTPQEGVKRGAEMPIPEMAGHVAALTTGAALPGLVGKGMRAAAEPVAESAINVRPIDRAMGRRPGAAVLDETTGVRPETVRRQAQAKLGDINNQLEGVVNRSNAPVDITPARGTLGKAETTARARNQVKEVGQLAPMQEHLAVPQPGFQGSVTQPPTPTVQKPSAVLGPNGQPIMVTAPGNTPPPVISSVQTPRGALNLKRGFGEEFVHNWNPETMRGAKGTAAQTYHSLAESLHNAVPESAELDKRATSLIPVAQRAEVLERAPGTAQQIARKLVAPTGALAGGIGGYYAGGVPGAVAGMVAPVVLGSPTAQMIAARALNLGSKALKSKPAALAGRATPIINATRREEEQ